MNNLSYLNLSVPGVISLKKIAHCKKYTSETPLHYQDQTPIVAYFIAKGNVLLMNGQITYKKLQEGTLLGYHELQNNIPSMFTAIVKNNTELWYIDKSCLLDLMNSKSIEMQNLYQELTNLNTGANLLRGHTT